MTSFAVILPAAGRSARFGRDKLAEPLRGTSVLERSIDAFAGRADVGIVLVAGRDNVTTPNPKVRTCPGGASRAHTVRAALATLPPEFEWVAVHDAARPLVSQSLIDRTWAAAREHGAAVPALPVALTIKEAQAPLPARVTRTIPRQSLWAMQTPQIIGRRELERAFDTCPIPLDQVTDDAQLIELAGGAVWLVEGEERNLKITTTLDLRIAEFLLDDA